MTYRIFKVAVVLLWLFYCIKVLAFRATATRQDAIIFLAVFMVGFGISLSEAIKLRNERKKRFEGQAERVRPSKKV